MKYPSPEEISNIADELSLGMVGHLNKKTGELLFIPDEEQFDFASEFGDENPFAEQQEKLEADPDAYWEIPRMSSREAFELMEEFANSLSNRELKSRLFWALDQRGPFRKFKNVIDNSGPHRDEWFKSKEKGYIAWVERRLRSMEFDEA